MKPTKREKREQFERDLSRTAQEYDMDSLTPSELVTLLEETEDRAGWAASAALIARGKASQDALIAGMRHPNAKIRASCALLLDHLADDHCVEPLRHALRHDPDEAVRRCAMHSLVCDGCKECPLNTDIVGALIESLTTDRSVQVRRRAAFYLAQQRPDVRIAPVLHRLLEKETDTTLRRRAQRALVLHERDVLIPSATGRR